MIVLPAVYCDRTILTKLLFSFMYLTNKINKTVSRFRHALFWPVRKLKLPHCAWWAIPCISHFKFSQNILRHVIFRNGIHHKTLVPYWSITRPVLVAFLLQRIFWKQYYKHKINPTLPISFSLVNITMMVELCSHNILHKSSAVSAKGPWVAM